MEQSGGERPSQEQCINQPDVQHSGVVNSSGAHFLQDRSWTGCRGSSTSNGSLDGDHLRQDRAQIPLCLDNLRGTCFRGESCKYYHAEPNEHGGSRFYQSERGGLGVFSKLGNSQLYREKDNDSRTRFASGGYRSRSPCRQFQSGRCHRGSSCPHLHPELVRYDKPTYNMSVEQKQVHGAMRVPDFGEGKSYGASRISQGQEEAYKENNTRTMTFSREHKSRSPCHNFLRGNCKFGSNCKRLHPINNFVRFRTNFSSQHHQGYGESVMHNSSRNRDFLREPRRRSPCRNFLSGKCHRGESCAHLHLAPVYDRTRYDSWRTQRHGGVPATTGTPHFNNGTLSTNSRIYQNHEDLSNHGIKPRWDKQVFYPEDQARSTKDDLQLGGKIENLDVTSRSWYCERHRSSNASDFGGNELIREREVCLQFTRGRCAYGDSCRYLHGYHKYASSNWSIRPTEVAADSGTLGVGNQCADRVMVEQHDGVKTATELSTIDQNGDASLMDGQKCEISGEKSVGLCNSAEGHQELSLWSQPFKKRRSRSRSPLIPRDDIRCTKFRRYDSRLNLHRDKCYNVARFQYPGRRSHTFERPMYRVNSHQSSNGAGTSMNPCYREKYDSKSVGLQRLDEVVSDGRQLAQCPSLGSQIANVGKKNDTESASSALNHSHIDQIDKESARGSIAADMPHAIAVIGLGNMESDSASLCEEHLVSPKAICSSILKEGNVELTNEKKAEVMPSMKTYLRKNQIKSCQGPIPCEETMKRAKTSTQQENGSIIDNTEKKVEPSLAAVEVSRRKLLVLDVNGLLADIVAVFPLRYTPDTIVSAKGVFKRPFCDDFLQFCFERYDVGIWTSRTKKNVTMVVDFLMKDSQNRLLFCWDQSHCTDTGYSTIENSEKPLVLKELKKLWDKKEESLPWKKGYYNETNTILLDDSPYKALRNPPYTAVFPYPYTFKDVQDKSLGPGGDLRVYLERLAEAENVQKFIQENPFGQRPITKTNLSWAFYSKIVGVSDRSLLQEKAEVFHTTDRIQLEKKANIVGISDGNLLEEGAEIGGASNGSQLAKKADIVGADNEIQLEEEAANGGTSSRSQLEEDVEILGTCNSIQTEEEAKNVGASDGSLRNDKLLAPSDRSELEEKANVVSISDGNLLEEGSEIGGASNGSQLAKKADIIGADNESQLEEEADIVGSQLEEDVEIVGTCNSIQTEQEAKNVGASYWS